MRHFREHFGRHAQQLLVRETLSIIACAPLYTPTMPRSGKAFSVNMTNCGPLGWVSDKERGYRYQPTHPVTGEPWPEMPKPLRDLWEEVADTPAPPEACLVNYYGPDAKMGLHRDQDEADYSAPVVSLSLGDTALFRIGGTWRKDPTRAFELKSGDVLVLSGTSRRAYHGVDRIMPGTSDLLSEHFPQGGRINLTLRRVTKSD